MGKFEDEIGRIEYTVETDTCSTDYEYGVYTEEARDRGLAELHAKYGKDNVRFKPNKKKR